MDGKTEKNIFSCAFDKILIQLHFMKVETL